MSQQSASLQLQTSICSWKFRIFAATFSLFLAAETQESITVTKLNCSDRVELQRQNFHHGDVVAASKFATNCRWALSSHIFTPAAAKMEESIATTRVDHSDKTATTGRWCSFKICGKLKMCTLQLHLCFCRCKHARVLRRRNWIATTKLPLWGAFAPSTFAAN